MDEKVCFQLAKFYEKLKPCLYHIFGKDPSKKAEMVTEKICSSFSNGSVSQDFRRSGELPETIINYLC